MGLAGNYLSLNLPRALELEGHCDWQNDGLPKIFTSKSPWTCEYIRFRGKGGWRLQMWSKLHTNLSQIIPEYPGPSVITIVLKIGRGRQKKESEKEMCLWKNDQIGAVLWLWRWRKGATSHGILVASWNWKRQENTFSPTVSTKEHSPADTLILVQWDPCWTFYFHTCKIINLCRVKPLGVCDHLL